MHLRSLRLRGFKSFPDTLELKLEPGVAVVVGPNGSGKSNVADAIVWAAGSLTPSELRAEKPDDVLFNGAEGRTPAESCEVELVFDNESGSFGELDFSEVSIARRLHRGGEGQYLVNKAQVRRTDLVELLADVGLGGSMHSIVSQGKVEAVLASKPEERRELVEEAAGLGKFKRRQHRAELKLHRVGIQVERARDVEAEVRKRLRPLALQATAAERAEKLAAEIAGLRARIAELDLAAADARRAAAEERKTAAAIGRRSAQEKLTALLAERHAAEEELADAAGKREAAIKALYRLQAATERIALRQEGAQSLLAGLRSELGEAETAASEVTDESTRELERTTAEATAAARAAAAAGGAAAERARAAQERLASLERAAAARAEERLDALRRERQGIEAELADAAGGREGATAALYRLGTARERIAMRAESVSALRERVRVELAESDAIARRPGPSPAELEAAANGATAAARAAAHARDDLAERTALATERLAALERSLAEREGIAPAARMLAEEGAELALSLLDVAPGEERAVAAALGWGASAVVAEDAAAGLALLRRARDAGLGSLAVLVGRRPAERVAELPVVPLGELLAATVPSVTAEGFGFDPQRGELWFAGEAAEAVLLELETRRRGLAAEVDALKTQAAAAEVDAAQAEDAADQAEAAYAQVAHLRSVRAADPGVLRRISSGADRLDEALLAAVAVAARLEQPLRARADAGAERAGELATELERVGALEHEARAASTSANERAGAAELTRVRLGGEGQIRLLHVEEAERDAVEREARELTDEAERLAAAAAEAGEAARSAVATQAATSGARRAAARDVDLLRRILTGAERLDDTLAAAAGTAERFEAPLRARVDAGASRAGELGAALRDLGAAEVELRQSAEDAAQRSTEIEIELTRVEAEAADARRRLEEASAEPADGDDRDELAARAERLETRRIQLGQVNPLAKEEYEAEKERLAELETQREDLEQSLKELADLRDDLAATVERRFADTYAAVAEHFEEVAATLFPGGEGRLRLVEPDEEGGGETGVEVELRPAGKKITRLGMLSGGEKALGAISFLFALFLAKPCPFYLLDEVEAALDDANIGRFVELLRRYADRAQFVVITHQKRTMEAADVLYGVTMGGDGVSQIVSRRLPREEAAALAS
ncbi:MAG TPA: AAA family ATPase [Gaiellaceae bacterium]|nr:AAA family ATPase [Gaiellaceae bacterium]